MAKLLGVIFQSDFKFVDHVDATLNLYSQRLFLLKQLRDQGMARGHLHHSLSGNSLKSYYSCLSCLGTIP